MKKIKDYFNEETDTYMKQYQQMRDRNGYGKN